MKASEALALSLKGVDRQIDTHYARIMGAVTESAEFGSVFLNYTLETSLGANKDFMDGLERRLKNDGFEVRTVNRKTDIDHMTFSVIWDKRLTASVAAISNLTDEQLDSMTDDELAATVQDMLDSIAGNRKNKH